jgi:DegV family protein with EDD domain
MVKIFSDTTSCIPVARAAELGITYFPQIIIFGNQEYRDDTELDTKKFLQLLRASPTLPKTAAPSPALYTPHFKKCVEEGQAVIVVCPSSEVSGTVRSAETAAQDFPGADIRVIDTLCVGSGFGTMTLCAQDWAKQGLSSAEIEKRLKEMIGRQRTYFMVDTLEYLHKGGRIGTAKKLVGSLLQVKPILAFKNGHTEPVDSERTKKKAMARFRQIILDECPHKQESHISIMHGDALEEAKIMAEELKQVLGIKDIPVYDIPPAILTHAGPGCFGVSFFVD